MLGLHHRAGTLLGRAHSYSARWTRICTSTGAGDRSDVIAHNSGFSHINARPRITLCSGILSRQRPRRTGHRSCDRSTRRPCNHQRGY